MFPSVDPTSTKAWSALQHHFETIKEKHLNEFFNADKNRFFRFSRIFKDILFDFSKNRITTETLNILLNLAEETHLQEAIAAMFLGAQINETEKRSVFHVALRNTIDNPMYISGKDVMPEVRAVLGHMKQFSNQIYNGEWKGYTGKPITDIVNIGIGGSHLGPFMVSEALKPYSKKNLNIHFISNIDGTASTEVLNLLDPETTLFIIASKSFTTLETITNAMTAREWFLSKSGEEAHIKKHFVAISTHLEAVTNFGIDEQNIFQFWDWVGGRYSLWSAIGLPVACYIGFDNFYALLKGAHEMDEHFRTTELKNNIPVLLGLISIWYNNFFNFTTQAIIPYDQYLQAFPAFLQQLFMESNGKSVTRKGEKVDYNTGTIIWGAAGTDSQHSFFQLIHQGSQIIPCDFMAPVQSQNPVGHHHELLMSNSLLKLKLL